MDAQLLTPDEISSYRGEFRKGIGSTRAPDFKEKYNNNMEKVWNESPLKGLITFDEFKSIVLRPNFRHNGRNHKKSKERKNVNVILDNEQKKVVFSQLVKEIVNQCGRLPDDRIMTAIGNTLGYSHAIWDVTKHDMVELGYEFIPVPNGYIVNLPNPDMQRMLAIEHEIRKLREERDQLSKKMHTTALAA